MSFFQREDEEIELLEAREKVRRIKKMSSDVTHRIGGEMQSKADTMKKAEIWAQVATATYGGAEEALKALKGRQIPWGLIIISFMFVGGLAVYMFNPNVADGLDSFFSNQIHVAEVALALFALLLIYYFIRRRRS